MTNPVNFFVIFLHIQKTGGITLQRLLRQKLGDSLLQRATRLLSQQHSHVTIEDALRAKQMRDRYFVGHCCFGVHRFLPQPFTYMTMLREPVSRVISLYYYSRSNPTAYYHYHAANCSLEEFALKTPLMELDNGQVRFLAGDHQDIFINRTPIGQCDIPLLELAQQNIEQHFSWVGLTEYFDQSLLLLAKQMNWKNCLYLYRNVSQMQRKQEVTAELKQQIADRNWLDVQLYQYAKQRLMQEVAQCEFADQKNLEKFQSSNRQFNQYFGPSYTVYSNLKARLKGQVGYPS